MSKRKRQKTKEPDPDGDDDGGADTTVPVAAAAAASPNPRRGRGRPVGNVGTSVIDQLIASDPRGCEKQWAKWKTHVKYLPLPAPYNADQYRCWIFNPVKGQGGAIATTGYGEIQALGTGKSKLKVHILAHFLHTGEQPQRKDPKLDISHRCHRKSCFNPHHLVREDTETNGSRDYCLSVAQIGGQWVDLCSHNPKCLRKGEAVKDFVVAAVPHVQLLNALNASTAANDASRAVIVSKDAELKKTLSAAAASS